MMNIELRDKTVEYLSYLKETGENYITLSSDALKALQHLKVSPGLAAIPIRELPPVVSSNPANPSNLPAVPETSRVAMPGLALPRYPNPLGTLEKIQALKDLSLRVSECPVCARLFRRSKNMVFGAGDPDADIMFVGEAPGLEEDELGEPFSGKAGELLTKMIDAMGLGRDKVYITTVVKNRPDMPPGSVGNRKPTLEEVEVSRPYTCSQIEIIKPRVLVSLGATALESLFKLEKSSITRMRGNWMEFGGIPLMPTFHPAYLLRNPTNEEKRKVWQDLLLVMEKIGLPISDKQRGFFLKK